MPISTIAACRRDINFDPNWEVTPRDVKSMLDRGDKFLFIDCRFPTNIRSLTSTAPS